MTSDNMAGADLSSTGDVRSIIHDLSVTVKDYDTSSNENGGTRNKLLSLAKDLITQLRNPMDVADTHMANASELVALRTCLHLKALDAIPFPGSATIDDIAKQTSASAALLERLLRMLVCTGFLLSPSTNTYAHTKHSFAYTLVPGPGMFFQLVYDESFLMIDNFHLYLAEKGYKEPVDQKYSPYAWKSKQEGTPIWDIMAQHPDRFHAFQAGLAHGDASIPLLGFFDFGKLVNKEPERPVLVDVGGGSGHSLAQILRAYSQFDPSDFVLQDLAPVVKKVADSDVLSKKVRLMEHDFFTEQPVKGAKAYFLRRVLHDYSDIFATTILSNIVPAMSHDSRILIADLMFPEHITTNEVGIAAFDITMLNMGGKERTEAGLRQILDDVGCEIVQIWKSDVGFGVIVEAKLKGSGERMVDGPLIDAIDNTVSIITTHEPSRTEIADEEFSNSNGAHDTKTEKPPVAPVISPNDPPAPSSTQDQQQPTADDVKPIAPSDLLHVVEPDGEASTQPSITTNAVEPQDDLDLQTSILTPMTSSEPEFVVEPDRPTSVPANFSSFQPEPQTEPTNADNIRDTQILPASTTNNADTTDNVQLLDDQTTMQRTTNGTQNGQGKHDTNITVVEVTGDRDRAADAVAPSTPNGNGHDHGV